MNSHTYLIIKDVDDQIISYLSPPTVLSLSAVNKYYLEILDAKRRDVNKIQCDMLSACKNNNLWIAQWIIDIYVQIRQVKHNNLLLGTNIDKIFDINQYLRAICINGCIEMAKMFLSLETIHGKIDIHDTNDLAFQLACKNGRKEMAEWLISLENTRGMINIHAENEYAFYWACKNGRKEIAIWLISLENTHGKIDIHTNDEQAFRFACLNGHKETAEWLISSENTHGKIDIHVYNETPFRWACVTGNEETAKWLLSLENTHGPIPKKLINELLS